ncbi:LVIVD repeat-containing protein [Martelella mediterranea]|uniref:LVIVD repeat-containing protein n=1 Tax=Martelella mediterranea TaxID=293089 RepID=A0A4R3NI88_9HYPH|nr:hypothetical protein [Martelella mediterranea]TCT27465.1 hypothetical protein EDC90_10842 [Martelella mediterranea]
MLQDNILEPAYLKSIRILGHSDQGGRLDGTQVMVEKGYAYVGHIFSKGFTIINVKDPKNPKTVNFVPAPPNTWNLHLQVHDNLLLVVHAQDQYSIPDVVEDERAYYKPTEGGAILQPTARNWSAGMAVYDLSNPEQPRQIGFLDIDGVGLHRIWYVGGRWAYASAKFDGFSDFIFITIDMADPTRPTIAGRYWLPGQNTAAGEVGAWPTDDGRYSLHHPIVSGDTAYCGWRDGCLVMLDISDRSDPKLISHTIWSPPFGGGTHNCVPLPNRDLLVVVDEAVLDSEEDGDKPIWIFDIREPANPISISTLPKPKDQNYKAIGGHFGPHNIHENRPGSFVSDELIFATYQNAGLRIFDIRDQYAPVEVGAFVPPAPKRLVDHRRGRPLVANTTDVFVDQNRLMYITDFAGLGLYIAEYLG